MDAVARRVCLFSLVVVGAFIPLSAVADDGCASSNSEALAARTATARELFREAAALAQNGLWEQALDRYVRSMALRPSPLTRYSIAMAQSHTGRLVESAENARTFLREATPEEQDYVPHVQDLLKSVEPRIARIRILIPGDPRGAHVRLDGQELPAAALGVEVLVNPGRHKIEATVPGHPPFQRSIDLAESISKTVVLSPPEERSDPAVPAIESRAPYPPTPTAGTILVVTGGTAFAAGAVLGMLAWSKAKDSPTQQGDDADQAKTLALLGDIGMAAGLISASAGAYLLLAPAPPPDTIGVHPLVGPDTAGLQLSGRF